MELRLKSTKGVAADGDGGSRLTTFLQTELSDKVIIHVRRHDDISSFVISSYAKVMVLFSYFLIMWEAD